MGKDKRRSRFQYDKYSKEALYLRLARQVLHMERSELAKQIGVSEFTIRLWELDRTPRREGNKSKVIRELDRLLGEERRQHVAAIVDDIKGAEPNSIKSENDNVS